MQYDPSRYWVERTTANLLSTPHDQLVKFLDIAQRHRWPVKLDDLHRVEAEIPRLPQLAAPETYVLVMTFKSTVETFERYEEALRGELKLWTRPELQDKSLRKHLRLNPVCEKPKPGLAWWWINPDAHIPTFEEEMWLEDNLGQVGAGRKVLTTVMELQRSDLAHASGLAMPLMHPRWRVVPRHINDLRLGGYLFSTKPSDERYVDFSRGLESRTARVYGLDLGWYGNRLKTAIPIAHPVRFSR